MNERRNYIIPKIGEGGISVKDAHPGISIDDGVKQLIKTKRITAESPNMTKEIETKVGITKKRKPIHTYRTKKKNITYREQGTDGKVRTITYVRARRIPDFIIGERRWGAYGVTSIYYDKPIKIKPTPKKKKIKKDA